MRDPNLFAASDVGWMASFICRITSWWLSLDYFASFSLFVRVALCSFRIIVPFFLCLVLLSVCFCRVDLLPLFPSPFFCDLSTCKYMGRRYTFYRYVGRYLIFS